MKVIKNRGVVPPGGRVRYIDPDDGAEFAHPYFQQVKLWAQKHRMDANLPIPLDWDAWFDEQVCRSTPTACIDVGDPPKEKAPGFFDLAANFAGSMIRWAKEGFPIVTYEEFKLRFAICAGDEMNPKCSHFKRWDKFGVTKCTKCGCSSVKLRLGTERCPIGKW